MGRRNETESRGKGRGSSSAGGRARIVSRAVKATCGRRCGRGQGEGVSRQVSGEGAKARSQESEPQRGRPVWLDGASEGQEEVQSGHEILHRIFVKTDVDKG